MAELATARLILRRFRPADLDNMILLESNPNIMKWGPARVPIAAEQTKIRFEAMLEKQPENEPLGIWAIETKEPPQFVGWMMLMLTGQEFPELGFMAVESAWGQGYITEAAETLLGHAFQTLNLRGVVALTDHNNSTSAHILQKLGFRFLHSFSKFDPVLNQETELHVYHYLP